MAEKDTSMKKTALCYLISTGITVLIGLVVYYYALPAMNVHSAGFWGYWLFLGLIYAGAHSTVRPIVCKKEISVVGKKSASWYGTAIGFGIGRSPCRAASRRRGDSGPPPGGRGALTQITWVRR